jgi:RNA polymerase sigma-70 factor (ECF subfamily)
MIISSKSEILFEYKTEVMVNRMKEAIVDDNDLVSAIQRGDKNAMKDLVERYKKKAFYLALGMVGNTDEALDISQEAFIRVFKSARKFDLAQRFFPWFYSIISNLCRDTLSRRERRDSKEVDINEQEYILITDSNPETLMIKSEEAQRLRKAIMKLDFADREIIMLKHFRDLSYDEIAELLEIPKGTVMSRLYYARKKLASLLNEV